MLDLRLRGGISPEKEPYAPSILEAFWKVESSRENCTLKR